MKFCTRDLHVLLLTDRDIVKTAAGKAVLLLWTYIQLRPIHIRHAGPMPFINSHMPAAPLPCSDSVVSFVKVRMVAGNIRIASPAV